MSQHLINERDARAVPRHEAFGLDTLPAEVVGKATQAKPYLNPPQVDPRPEDGFKEEVQQRLTPGNRRRLGVLRQIEQAVCKDRQTTYGDAEDNFSDIARHCTIHFRKKWPGKDVFFTPDDVAVICAYIKLSRLATSPGHLDNWVDLGGYAVCGAGIMMGKSEPLTKETKSGE